MIIENGSYMLKQNIFKLLVGKNQIKSVCNSYTVSWSTVYNGANIAPEDCSGNKKTQQWYSQGNPHRQRIFNLYVMSPTVPRVKKVLETLG